MQGERFWRLVAGEEDTPYISRRGDTRSFGVDVSPLAIRVCRLRGLKNAQVKSIEELTPQQGTFDTILMMGNNFGLFHNPKTAKKTLKQFRQITSQQGRIIAESLDPYPTRDAFHLAYHLL